MTEQKFRRYQFVYVCKEKDGHSSRNGDFTGIISGSYSDQFGGKNVDSYTIYKLHPAVSINPEGGVDSKVMDCCAWYGTWQLTLLKFQGADLAAEMIEQYNFGGLV